MTKFQPNLILRFMAKKIFIQSCIRIIVFDVEQKKWQWKTYNRCQLSNAGKVKICSKGKQIRKWEMISLHLKAEVRRRADWNDANRLSQVMWTSDIKQRTQQQVDCTVRWTKRDCSGGATAEREQQVRGCVGEVGWRERGQKIISTRHTETGLRNGLWTNVNMHG